MTTINHAYISSEKEYRSHRSKLVDGTDLSRHEEKGDRIITRTIYQNVHVYGRAT